MTFGHRFFHHRIGGLADRFRIGKLLLQLRDRAIGKLARLGQVPAALGAFKF